MKTIVAAVDFSAVTYHVVEAARELAEALKARVLLLHVVAPPVNVVTYDMPAEAFVDELKFAKETSAKKLDALRRVLDADGIECELKTLQGHAVEEILREAEESDASYIVMGSHGHGALYELLAGSTSHGVIHKANCPIVILPRSKSV
ncbi:MAG TPA: universal stress protein [Opitutaceae bacterium]